MHDERQAQRAATPPHQCGSIEHAAAVAAQAVGMQFVVMLMRAGDAARVDHAADWNTGAGLSGDTRKSVQRDRHVAGHRLR